MNQSEWAGPIELEFTIDKDHSSLRYNSMLMTQSFSYYPPPVFVGSNKKDDAPERIILTLGKVKESGWDSKFKSEVRNTVENVFNYLVYDFEEEMGHSIKYFAKDLKGNATLYAPKGLFRGLKYPEKLYVAIRLIT